MKDRVCGHRLWLLGPPFDQAEIRVIIVHDNNEQDFRQSFLETQQQPYDTEISVTPQ